MPSFKEQLAYGKVAENQLAEYLRSQGETVEMAPDGLFSGYDLTANGKHYECKRDRYTDKTGNMCIEHHCSGKESGISVTTADFWHYQSETKNWLIPTEVLRAYIDEKRYHKDIKCGNGFLARAYLFKSDLFKQYEFNM